MEGRVSLGLRVRPSCTKGAVPLPVCSLRQDSRRKAGAMTTVGRILGISWTPAAAFCASSPFQSISRGRLFTSSQGSLCHSDVIRG